MRSTLKVDETRLQLFLLQESRKTSLSPDFMQLTISQVVLRQWRGTSPVLNVDLFLRSICPGSKLGPIKEIHIFRIEGSSCERAKHGQPCDIELG